MIQRKENVKGSRKVYDTQIRPHSQASLCLRVCVCNTRRDGRKEREKNMAAQGAHRVPREQDRDTIARALGALSTNPLGSSCGHLRDVTRGNSWSLLSCLLCCRATLTFCERGSSLSLAHWLHEFPLLLSFPSLATFFSLNLMCTYFPKWFLTSLM